jgi:hypothetical protein
MRARTHGAVRAPGGVMNANDLTAVAGGLSAVAAAAVAAYDLVNKARNTQRKFEIDMRVMEDRHRLEIDRANKETAEHASLVNTLKVRLAEAEKRAEEWKRLFEESRHGPERPNQG